MYNEVVIITRFTYFLLLDYQATGSLHLLVADPVEPMVPFPIEGMVSLHMTIHCNNMFTISSANDNIV